MRNIDTLSYERKLKRQQNYFTHKSSTIFRQTIFWDIFDLTKELNSYLDDNGSFRMVIEETQYIVCSSLLLKYKI
jgi:hypothetical protein